MMRFSRTLCGAWMTFTLLVPVQAQSQGLDRLSLSGKADPEVLLGLESQDSVGAFLLFDLSGLAGVSVDASMPRALRETWVDLGTEAVLAGLADQKGLEVIATFRRFPGVAVRASAEALAQAAEDPLVSEIVADHSGGIALEQSVPLVGADVVHDELGFRGMGRVVAVLDTGYDATHTDLSDDLVDEACFCFPNCCPGGTSSRTGSGAALDENGHGTHVAGIITAAGRSVGPGVAPDASIMAIRVLDAGGRFTTLANLVRAFEHIEDSLIAVDAVNMSLATDTLYSSSCDNNFRGIGLTTVVDAARASGVLVAVASGNNGSVTSMGAPACLSGATSVGATYDADFFVPQVFNACSDPAARVDDVACFSNRNNATTVFAPGSLIRSSRRGGGGVNFAGTSMAAPAVAGCAALLREVDPSLSAEELETLLLSTGRNIADASGGGRNFKRIDCESAVGAAIDALTTTTTTTSSTTTTTMLAPLCGDANGDLQVKASDAQLILRAAVGEGIVCPLERCDVSGNGLVQASDALSALRLAVGLEQQTNCPA